MTIEEKKDDVGGVTLKNADGAGVGERVHGNFDYKDSPEALKRQEVLNLLNSCIE